MVLCPRHGYHFFEDGCHDCAAEVRATVVPTVVGHVVCARHGTKYWSEDACPACLNGEPFFLEQARRDPAEAWTPIVILLIGTDPVPTRDEVENAVLLYLLNHANSLLANTFKLRDALVFPGNDVNSAFERYLVSPYTAIVIMGSASVPTDNGLVDTTILNL